MNQLVDRKTAAESARRDVENLANEHSKTWRSVDVQLGLLASALGSKRFPVLGCA